jgi:predicted dehydrogenase
MVRVAIIAATGTGQKRLLPALAGSSEVRVVAIHARDAASGRALAGRFAVERAFTDPAAMLDEVAPDLVLIASPPFLHREHVGLAAARGIPVLCEKPLATTLPDAIAIARDVQAARIPFALAHHVRHQHAVTCLRELLEAHTVGPVRRVDAQWSFRINSGSRNARWKLDAARGGTTAFHDAGVHALDLVLHLFGKPQAVRATGLRTHAPTYDNVVAHLVYRDMIATVASSHVSARPLNALVIEGEDGRMVVPQCFGERSVCHIDVATRTGRTRRTFPVENPYRNEVEHFVASVFLGTPTPGATIHDALHVMCVLDAIDTSMKVPATQFRWPPLS